MEREYVRNHATAGFVCGRFTADDGHDILVVQTLHEIVVMRAGTTLPSSKEDVQRQAVQHLIPVVQSLLTGGLTADDVRAAWHDAIAYEAHASVNRAADAARLAAPRAEAA